MTGFIVAMPSEMDALRKVFGEADCRCALSGVGKVNAARCATELILEHHPDCIINSGFTGALAPGVKVGDIVVATEVAHHDVWHGEGNVPGQAQGEPLRFNADGFLLKKAETALRSFKTGHPDTGVHFGLIATGDQFFISAEEDGRILGLYPDALSSDMESASIAQVCRHFGVPFLCIRVVSDVHTSSLAQRASYESSVESADCDSFSFLKYFI